MSQKKPETVEIVELWAEGLSGPDRLFVQEYCSTYNAHKAYKKAYPDASAASCRSNSVRTRERLEDAISKYAALITKDIRAELESQLLQIYRIRGTYDVRDLYNAEGHLKPASELGDLIYVIDEVTPYELTEGRGKNKTKRIVYSPKKLADRQANLDKLDRIIALIKPEDRTGEGGSGGGYILLPQSMTTEEWIKKYGSRKETKTPDDAEAGRF